MDENKISLTEFIQINAPLLTAFGVFTALAVYFKNSGLPDTSVFSPLFLSLLIIFELYINILREKKKASTTLSLFEGGLSIVLISVFIDILSAYAIGRSMFGMAVAICIFAILYPRFKKHLENKFETHKKLLALLYLVVSVMWYYVIVEYIKLLNFEPSYKEILIGLASIIILPSVILIDYLFKNKKIQ
ncbi:MAG: hypothetical protein WC556_01595 [Candidatus Methanoperedens sp.]